MHRQKRPMIKPSGVLNPAARNEWIMSIAKRTQDVCLRIMVDSGGFCSVCPKTWHSDVGLHPWRGKHDLQLKSAIDDPFFGHRDVQIRSNDHQEVHMKFPFSFSTCINCSFDRRHHRCVRQENHASLVELFRSISSIGS